MRSIFFPSFSPRSLYHFFVKKESEDKTDAGPPPVPEPPSSQSPNGDDGSSNKTSAKLAVGSLLAAAAVAGSVFLFRGCNKEIKVDPKLLRDKDGVEITDKVTDTKDLIFLSSVDEVLTKARLGKIEKIEMYYNPDSNGNDILLKIKLTNGYHLYLPRPKDEKELSRLISGLRELPPVPIYIENHEIGTSRSTLWELVLAFGPTVLLLVVAFTALGALAEKMGKGNLMPAFLRPDKSWKPVKSDKRFSDIKGNPEAIRLIKDIVELIKNMGDNTVGAKIPKGILLKGPPGTGKTLMAEVIAGEAGIPFIKISASEFIRLYVGAGPLRVRQLFGIAKKHAPCILFIDEIDAMGSRHASKGGGDDERNSTLTQILTEMDGFGRDTGVLVLAATNRPEILDEAMLRPGRFDYHIPIDPPVTSKQRAEILEIYISKKKAKDQMEQNIDPMDIARKTPGFTGADLESVIDKAAMNALREKVSKITMAHIDEAISQISVGIKTGLKPTDEELRAFAVHEFLGHFLVGMACDFEFEEISLIPRGDSLGHATLRHNESNELLKRKDWLLKLILMALGGRAAEEVYLPSSTTGAGDDLNKVRDLIRKLLSSNLLGNFSMVDYSNPSVELKGEDLAIATQVFNKASATVLKISQTFPKKEAMQMIGEIFDRGEIKGDEANALALRYINDDTIWEQVRKLVDDFVKDPQDKDGSLEKAEQ